MFKKMSTEQRYGGHEDVLEAQLHALLDRTAEGLQAEDDNDNDAKKKDENQGTVEETLERTLREISSTAEPEAANEEFPEAAISDMFASALSALLGGEENDGEGNNHEQHVEMNIDESERDTHEIEQSGQADVSVKSHHSVERESSVDSHALAPPEDAEKSAPAENDSVIEDSQNNSTTVSTQNITTERNESGHEIDKSSGGSLEKIVRSFSELPANHTEIDSEIDPEIHAQTANTEPIDDERDAEQQLALLQNILSEALDNEQQEQTSTESNTHGHPQDHSEQNSIQNVVDDDDSHSQLLAQLTSAIHQSEVIDKSDSQHKSSNDSISDELQSAIVELIGPQVASDLGHNLDPQLICQASTAEAPSTTDTPGTKKISSMSIAETLAMSRRAIEKNRAAQSNKIDLMLQRRGFHRQPSQTPAPRYLQEYRDATSKSSSSSPSQSSTTDSMVEPALTQTSPEIPVTTTSQPTTTDNDDASILAALLVAKQVMGINDDVEADSGEVSGQASFSNGAGEFVLNPEAMDAVQAVLQALGQSLVEEESISSFMGDQGPRRARVKRSKNAVLTPEDKEKIRLDNRERKKKWRGNNSDRNKDNDLRARLHRRAAQIYGREDSEEKRAWFETEFQKRRERRLQRENSGERFDIASFTRTFNINDPPSQEDVQSAIGSLSQSGNLNKAVSNLVKDPQLLKSLSGFFSDSSRSDVPDLTTGKQQIRAIGNGGFVSTFQIKRNKPTNNGNSYVSMPSRAPDKGLTSLVKSVRRANVPPPVQQKIANSQSSPSLAPRPPSFPEEDATERQIRELAGMLSRAVESADFCDEPLPKRPKIDETPAPIPKITAETVSKHLSRGALSSLGMPRPPQYVITSGKPSRGSLPKSRIADDRVLAMGFPPLLSGMTVKR